MSAKFFIVIFVLAAIVTTGSVVIGTLILGETNPIYIPSEQILTSFILWNDGSWELKIKNDHSEDIKLNNLFISVNDIKINSSLSDNVPSQGYIRINSDPTIKTSGGVAGFNYLAFINIKYVIGNQTVSTTRQHNGFYRQI